MKDSVFIKIYRNGYSSEDFRDLVADEMADYRDDLRLYCEEIGKIFHISAVTRDPFELVEFVPFCEVEYTGEMSFDEKRALCEKIKLLFLDGTVDGGEKQISVTVKFKRIYKEDIFEI